MKPTKAESIILILGIILPFGLVIAPIILYFMRKHEIRNK